MKCFIGSPLCLLVVVLLAACGGQGVPPAPPGEGVSPPSETAGVPVGGGPSGSTVSTTVPVTSGVSAASGATWVRLPVPVMERVDPVVEEVSGGGFTSVSAGWSYSCGLRVDRSVECWEWRADLSGHPDRMMGIRSLDDPELLWSKDLADGTPPGGEFVMVDAGWAYACGIRPTGGVECWGWNPVAVLEPPGGEFTSVSAGLEHACALRSGGEVECWGFSSQWKGVLVLPDGPFTAIAAGVVLRSGFLCGLRPGGEVECWGSGYGEGEASPPSGEFKSIIGEGGSNVCGFRPDGSVECWRLYYFLPDFADEYVWETSYFQLGGVFESVSPGTSGYACGLHPSGEAECWNQPEERMVPVLEGKFTSVIARGHVACGLPVGGGVVCWDVQTGENSWWLSEGEFKSLSLGGSHTCGLRVDGEVECWEHGEEFGAAFPPGGRFESVNVNKGYSCGLRPSGEVECWGSDEFGKSSPPAGVFTQITTSEDFACGLRTDGDLECWGGRDSLRRQAKVVPPRERLVSVDAGWGGWSNYDTRGPGVRYGGRTDWGSSCGLRPDGAPLCWGDTNSVKRSSVLRPPGGEFLNVRMGQSRACGLRPGGSVECGGRIGVAGEEGWTYEEGSTVYTDPSDGGGFVDVTLGGWHACGLRPDGGVYCWNWWREAMDTDYALEGPYESISAGYSHSCGLRRDGGVDCWGLTGEIQRLPESPN